MSIKYKLFTKLPGFAGIEYLANTYGRKRDVPMETEKKHQTKYEQKKTRHRRNFVKGSKLKDFEPIKPTIIYQTFANLHDSN